MGARYFGARVQRIEDPKLISGQGQYLDDLDIPGTLHAAFTRSSYAHARITGINTEAARAAPGVIAVLTLADLGPAATQPMPCMAPAPFIKQIKTTWPLAKDSVHFVGEAIAVVVADSRHRAEDAAGLVEIDYDPLPTIIDCTRALDPDAPRAHADSPDNLIATMNVGFGDAASVFAKAAHVFREHMALHRGGCHSMECRGVLAQPNGVSGRLEVWSSTQAPYGVRRALAHYLGRDESSIRVTAPDVGGGFGPKAGFYPEEYTIALVALKLGRPIKWVEDRREHFLATHQQRDQTWDVEVAADASGRILAMRGQGIHENGAYVPYGMTVPNTLLNSFPGPYALEALDITLHSVFTNAVANTPVRGAGRPNACFVMERLVDRVAHELGLEAAEVRRKSFIRKDQFPYATGLKGRDGKTQITYDSGDYHACLETAISKFADFRKRQAAARAERRYIGMGVASYVEDTGLGPYEGATVRVHPSGKVLVQTGAAGQGQGLKTILAQITADALGVKIEDITVETADTDKFPLGMGTVGSRVAVNAGSAVHTAATQVREKALASAAAMLSSGNKFLEIEDGDVRITGEPDKKVSLGQVAARHAGTFGMPLPPGTVPDLAATAYHDYRGQPFASGTNVCEVEVDIETGEVKIVRYVVAHDCGRLIHPGLVDGQIHGGVVHGIGNALFERMRYDESGQPVTINYGDYLLPMAPEMPRIEVHHLETPSPLNPIGVKGAGEGGTIPATACIIAAVEDALRPFGVRITEHPIDPERILALIEQGRQQ